MGDSSTYVPPELGAEFRPHCCVCNKPVEEFFVAQSDFTLSTTLVARCHGQTDECELPEEFMLAWGSGDARIERFEAFRTEKLPEAVKALPGTEGA